ncbi:ankyrin repeat-containing domain protein [Xylaria telfairii]|nr:ankyrin repeat-containing domain protein [Xylaria telfairii]
MDPLSISGSVAGIVGLAGTVFSLAAKYIKEVKDAPQEAKDLLNEVKQFSILLHHLSLVARELEITTKAGEEALQDSPNLQWHHIHDCQTILNRVEIGLRRTTDNLESSSTLKKIRSRLKWPFSSDDTDSMIQTIHRHKQTINIALSASSYSRLAICLSRQEEASNRQEETNKHLGNIEDTVNKILEIDTKVFLDEKRKGILDFFTKFANPWHDFEMVQSLRHPLTGLWFTKSGDFNEWIATPGSRLWVTGIPGAGKSVLAGLVLRECLNLSSMDSRKATTYFFCTYRNKATHSARNLMSSLVSQLARQNEEAFQILKAYHQELASQEPLAAEPSIQKLLTVFETMSQMFDQVFVVVDGLDECETDEIVGSLSQLAIKKNSTSITTLLLSRDVVHIRDLLESDFGHIEIAARTDDIQRYVYSELERRIESKQLRLRNAELKAEIVDKLVHGAKGMFRWVACQLDYLGELPNDRERRNALSKLPPTLPATYERILMKVEQSSKEVRELVQKTLLLIRASLHDVNYLCEALSLRDNSDTLTEDDRVDEYEIMLRCSSLIRKSADGTKLEFSHFTVQEFLEGIDPAHPTLCHYRTSEHCSDAVLAQTCLRYLMLQDFEKQPRADIEYIQYIQNRTETRPFYNYCANLWVRLWDKPDTNSIQVDDTTMRLIRKLFERRKSKSFYQWVVKYVHSLWTNRYFYINLDSSSPQTAITNLGIASSQAELSFGETQTFVRFLAAIIRPDFTPLHMASILNFPSLCAHLLGHGAKVNLNSRFGTPLHCALGGMMIFLTQPKLANSQIAAQPLHFKQLIQRNQTVRLLLAAGASATPRLSTPFQQRTLMGTMHLSPAGFDIFALLPSLLQAGLIVEGNDVVSMERRLKFICKCGKTLNHRSTIATLLTSLESTDDSSSPIKRLYSVIHQCAQSEYSDLINLVLGNIHNDLVDSISKLDILKSLIKDNDVVALEKMVGENRHDLFTNAKFNIYGEQWTAVHLACASSSPDVLELLLKIGSNPETTTQRGTKPIHLVNDRDGGETLRALLQHQVSTTAISDSLGTIWHSTIHNGDMQTLNLLVSLASDRQEALQIASGSGETAICVALNKGNEDAVMLLLEHCPTPSFWKSTMPLYRQAARLGSLHVVKKLLDMGIQPDDFDDDLGSPLHDINPRASLSCVKLLVETFPHYHRPRKDGRTPFQSLLMRAAKNHSLDKGGGRGGIGEDAQIQAQVLNALLPTFSASNPEEIPEEITSTWPFFCSTVIEYISRATLEVGWIKEVLTHFINVGLISCFEERYKISALVLYATKLDEVLSTLLPAWLATRQGNLWNQDDRNLSLLNNWECHSWMLLQLASKTAFRNSAMTHHCVIRLLSLAILHNDGNLVEWLLQNGVDIHQRVDPMSALEIACLPMVDISEDIFRCVLSYVKTDRLNEHNEGVRGLNIVHFVGVSSPFQERSLWKLGQILRVGANVNAVSSDFKHKHALDFHIFEGNITTAEVLLRAGADPWLADANGFDAALAAVYKNKPSLLKIIAEHSTSHKLIANWNRTWKNPDWYISGANAFHLAARQDSTECMRIYLEEKWLEDLESVDDDLRTPMHHAAQNGQESTIRFLHDHGCNIDSTSRDGKSPLHLAIEREQLGAVKQLLRLGAEMKADANGLSPLAYAYRTGDLRLVDALERHNENNENETFQLSRKGVEKMTNAFSTALNKGDLNACERFVPQRLPIDLEICYPWHVTPLMVALSKRMPSRVVDWLLSMGAKVSIVFEGPNLPEYATALEAAIAVKDYNHLLPTLLRRYSEEDGDFSRLKQTPLHVAVHEENYEGLRVLLDELHQLSYNVKDVVNQKNALFSDATALHLAARADDLDAATLLVNNGASLDLTDSWGSTPLHDAAYFGSIKILKFLIERGVCTEPLTLHHQWTPLMFACVEGEVEVAGHLLLLEPNVVKDSLGFDLVDITLKGRADESSAVRLCAMLFRRGFDLHRMDTRGVCAIFTVMAHSKHWVLRHLLREYPLSLRIQHIQWSFPWILNRLGSDKYALSNITRGYRLIHRYVGRGVPLDVSDSVATGKSSLLYLAASSGYVAAVDDLLSIGLDIETEVCEEGTALAIAAAHGQFDVVKYLARRGAQLFRGFGRAGEGVMAATRGQKEVIQWLLVNRYTDQAKITNADPNADQGDRNIREWTGVVQVRVLLKWEWEKRRAETMLEYAARSQTIMKELEGEVVKPLVEDEDEWSDEDF